MHCKEFCFDLDLAPYFVVDQTQVQILYCLILAVIKVEMQMKF